MDESPVPAWAYQQALAALEQHRQRADNAEKQLRNEKFTYDNATIERMAKAIADIDFVNGWRDMTQAEQSTCCQMARAALGAVRGTTE